MSAIQQICERIASDPRARHWLINTYTTHHIYCASCPCRLACELKAYTFKSLEPELRISCMCDYSRAHFTTMLFPLRGAFLHKCAAINGLEVVKRSCLLCRRNGWIKGICVACLNRHNRDKNSAIRLWAHCKWAVSGVVCEDVCLRVTALVARLM
jgi:hypothetical protein